MSRTITLWIVGHNMAGYLPESDPWYVRGKRRAVSASRSDARSDRDAMNEGLPRRERYHLAGRTGDYWLTADRGADYHYWVHPVEAVAVTRPAYETVRCDGCQCLIGNGYRPEDDTYWHIPDAGANLCEDCAS